ncbi:MAG: hypothetical protein KatS3mg115_1901 [Candidatus Poribacteria bacterium]|nr:MAG: hypothetical protein KatS3mg115_1901 [Candidatus Poribacteria bacterium]
MNRKNERHEAQTPQVQLIRDPRDLRELITELLGLSLDASGEEAARPTEETGAGFLTRRRRERAWQLLQDPLNRLTEEVLLYPLEPIPTPEAEAFPQYEPELPPPERLLRPEQALHELLRALLEALPQPEAIPEPQWEEALRPKELLRPKPVLRDPLDAFD